MTAPRVYVDPSKDRGQSLYEHAASRYVGGSPWPAWSSLPSHERARWADMEDDDTNE